MKPVRVSDPVKLGTEPRCPRCNKMLDGCNGLDVGCTQTETMRPKDGDLSVCDFCGEILCFTVAPAGEVGLRAALAADLDELKGQNPDAYRILVELSNDVRSGQFHKRTKS